MKPLILDSALGTEIENRGEFLPSFKTSIWSAYCLIHNPDLILQIHIDNIEAGADVITTSNYQATPELLKREPTAPLYSDLAKKSLELCQKAVDMTGAETKIAGCFPPIHVTFRPDLSGNQDQLDEFYSTLGAIYKGNTDIIICETMASIYEGTTAASIAKEFSKETWLSWTTRGNKGNASRLPSTELLEDAIIAGSNLGVNCQLVNCVHADEASKAILKLKAKNTNFGVYANSSVFKYNPLDGFVNDSDEYHHQHSQFINSDEYGDFAKKWIEDGVYVLGGCCRTSTDHIKKIRELVDSL
jgi:S-methylmethionine-dependent homocysteine/selenocysteine methylase